MPRGACPVMQCLGTIVILLAVTGIGTLVQRWLRGYDARTIYGLKARILYRAGTVQNEDFSDIDRLNFNPSYPLLLPLLEAQMDWALGTDEGPGMKILFAGFVLSLVAIYARQTRRF